MNEHGFKFSSLFLVVLSMAIVNLWKEPKSSHSKGMLQLLLALLLVGKESLQKQDQGKCVSLFSGAGRVPGFIPINVPT